MARRHGFEDFAQEKEWGFSPDGPSSWQYKVKGRAHKTFDNDHLERLTSRAIGQARVISSDGVDVGWTAGDHVLDTRFDLEKNVINDALHFAFRIDQLDIPGKPCLYTQVEMEGVAAANPRW